MSNKPKLVFQYERQTFLTKANSLKHKLEAINCQGRKMANFRGPSKAPSQQNRNESNMLLKSNEEGRDQRKLDKECVKQVFIITVNLYISILAVGITLNLRDFIFVQL